MYIKTLPYQIHLPPCYIERSLCATCASRSCSLDPRERWPSWMNWRSKTNESTRNSRHITFCCYSIFYVTQVVFSKVQSFWHQFLHIFKCTSTMQYPPTFPITGKFYLLAIIHPPTFFDTKPKYGKWDDKKSSFTGPQPYMSCNKILGCYISQQLLLTGRNDT